MKESKRILKNAGLLKEFDRSDIPNHVINLDSELLPEFERHLRDLSKKMKKAVDDMESNSGDDLHQAIYFAYVGSFAGNI